jgi:tetratricopeptide (TPR) repeat protein
MLGRVLHASKHLILAEACLQRALALAPGHLDALAALGALLSELNRHDESERALRSAVLRRPSDPRLLVRLADVLERAGKPEEARAAYWHAVSRDPGSAEAKNNLAVILHSEGKLEQAQKLLERLLSVQPNHAEAHYNLGRVHAERHNFELAKTCYHRAIALRPRYFEALNNLGNLHVRKEQFELGIVHLYQALDVVPTQPFVYRNICLALDSAGRRGEAIDLLRQRIASYESLAELRPLLANHLAVDRRFDEALHELHTFLKVCPDSADAYTVLGAVHQESGLLDDAVKAYKRATDLAPSNLMTWANYASGLSALERLDEAESVLRNSVKRWPADPELARRLANLISETGRHQEALAMFQQIQAKSQPTALLLSDQAMA